MVYKSINPYDNKEIATFSEHTDQELESILESSRQAFVTWREVPIEERSEMMSDVAELLRQNIGKYAKTITLEMGKPIREARAEIEKCAWVCEFYAVNAENFLADELIETDAHESFISFDPLGCVFAIMPWNFPFWQVFRFAAPNLMAGNTALLKHAPNVFGCAKHIEKLFQEAGLPEDQCGGRGVPEQSLQT